MQGPDEADDCKSNGMNGAPVAGPVLWTGKLTSPEVK
jgi:hypothetical protein